MNKDVDNMTVPVPMKVLAQLKAMSAFSAYETMNASEVWAELDECCEKVEKGLSVSLDIVAQARGLFEIQKTEGMKEAHELIDEMRNNAPQDVADIYMTLVAITLQKLDRQYEEK